MKCRYMSLVCINLRKQIMSWEGAAISCPFDSVRGKQGKLVQRQCCIHEQAARLVWRPPSSAHCQHRAAHQAHQQAFARCGPATDASAGAQPPGDVMARWPPHDATCRSWRELNPLSVASALGVSVHTSLSCMRVEQTLAA